MKFGRICSMLVSACLGAAMLTGCSGIAPNTVFSCDDLPGKTIGVQSGTTGADYALKLQEKPAEGQPAAKVVGYEKGADAVNDLKLGKLDCVIIDNEPARVFVSQNKELQVLPDVFLDEQYAIAVGKGNTELIVALNDALLELRDDGTISMILANYIGDNTGNYQYTSPEGVSRKNGELVMATNLDFAPYEWEDENGKAVGIDIDIFNALCDKLGYEPVIKDMKFEEILDSVHNGEADIGMGALTITTERMKDVDFTDSYAKGVQVIITRKD